MPQLYARVFLQILDSSLADDWQTRHVFEDLLKLSNMDGVVDMTREAISRRTNTPQAVVDRALNMLEAPDPRSRDPEEGGRRIVRLDDHRDWGWRIVNFQKYDVIRATKEMREWNSLRMARYRSHKKSPPVPPKEPEVPPSPPPEHSPTCAKRSTTCSTTSLTAVELPDHFPKSERDAIADSTTTGVPNDFVRNAWNECAGRGGTDRTGQIITSWPRYIKGAYDRFIDYQKRNGNGHSSANTTPIKTMKTATVYDTL